MRRLPQAAAERLIAERRTPFESFEQPALRARLNRHDLECLAHADALPLSLQNHNEDVEFRNIWIRPLDDNGVVSPAGPVGPMQ